MFGAIADRPDQRRNALRVSTLPENRRRDFSDEGIRVTKELYELRLDLCPSALKRCLGRLREITRTYPLRNRRGCSFSDPRS
jgi:hypothetical protein